MTSSDKPTLDRVRYDMKKKKKEKKERKKEKQSLNNS